LRARRRCRARPRFVLALIHIGRDWRGECGKSPAELRAPAIAGASLVYSLFMSDGLAAAMAGNTYLRTGWTRFQKTADLNHVSPGSNDATAKADKGAWLSQGCPISKG